MQQQGSLFDLITSEDAPASLAGVLPAMRAEMNVIAGQDEKGRELLKDRVVAVARREGVALTAGGGKQVSMDQFNKWLQSQDMGHAPHFMAILCFCLATGNARPLRPVFKALGLQVIRPEELEILEYGKTCIALREANRKKKSLEARL